MNHSRVIFGISFVVLSFFNLVWLQYWQQNDTKARLLRAETMAEQLATTLEVIAADRIRALDELSGNWPIAAANQVDWFNYQARSLSKMLPGIYDVWLVDQQGTIVWSINPAVRVQVQQHQLTSVLAAARFSQSDSALIHIDERPFVTYQREVQVNNRPQWHLVALIDVKATIQALTADLAAKPFAFHFSAENQPLYQLGLWLETEPAAQQSVSFAGSIFSLQVQSIEQQRLNPEDALLLGELIVLLVSTLISAWFRQFRKNKQVQQVYQAAANGSPDGMLIFMYETTEQNFDELKLFSFNSAALALFPTIHQHASWHAIALAMGLTEIEHIVEKASKEPMLHQLLKTKKTPVAADWLDLTIVRIPNGIALTLRDVSNEQKLQKQIRYQADHDQLTGLLNRYAFGRALDAVMNSRQTCYLCYIDMDHFKLINDSCGHLAGDDLLRKTAGLLAAHLAAGDTLARVGGDEFCLLLVERDLAAVKTLLDRLLVAISQFRFQWQEQVFVIGASIGVVAVTEQFSDATSLIRAADSGCYLAKNASRNSYFVVEEQEVAVNHLVQERNYVAMVRKALLTDSFELYAQPIVPITAKMGSHIEILLRLRDEKGQMISPSVFIPLAERQGIMCDIDVWVVGQVLTILEQQLSQLQNLSAVALNISGISLSDHKFMKKIKKLIKASSVPAELICFEITETAAVSNMAQAQLFIQELRLLGCHFALDDFGVGMSSFGYLRNMAVDFVKIDGSFVKGMANNSADAVMVKAITDIAHSLQKQVIAEFVEDEATLALLAEFGVEYAQGYGIAKPQPLQHALNVFRC